MSTDEQRAAELVEAVRMAAYWVGYDSASRRYDPTHQEAQTDAVDAAIAAVAQALRDARSEGPS